MIICDQVTTLCLQLDGSYKTPILSFHSENDSDFLNRPPNTNLYNVTDPIDEVCECGDHCTDMSSDEGFRHKCCMTKELRNLWISKIESEEGEPTCFTETNAYRISTHPYAVRNCLLVAWAGEKKNKTQGKISHNRTKKKSHQQTRI